MQTITEPAPTTASLLPADVADARDGAAPPAHDDAAIGRADGYLTAGLVVEAAEIYREQVDRSGDDRARLGLARCAFLRRNLHEAVGILQTIPPEAAVYPEAVNDMGVILCELGLLEEARTHIEEAARLMPTNPLPLRNLVDVTLALEDLPACRAHCDDYLALAAGDDEVRAIRDALDT